MPLGMFQNPLHLINSLIDCIYSTQEYFYFCYILLILFYNLLSLFNVPNALLYDLENIHWDYYKFLLL